MKHKVSAATFKHAQHKKELDRKYADKFGYGNVSEENWNAIFSKKEEEIPETGTVNQVDSIELMKQSYALVRKVLDFCFRTVQEDGQLVILEELGTTSFHKTLRYAPGALSREELRDCALIEAGNNSIVAGELIGELIALSDQELELFFMEFFAYRDAALKDCQIRAY